MKEVIKRGIRVMGLTLMVVLPLLAQFQMPFSDNFNDGDDSDWSWYTEIGSNPPGQPSHGVVNGVERIVTHDQNNTLLANGTATLSNYYVEADMRIVQLLDDAYGGLRLYAYNNGGIGYNSTYYVLDICHRDHYWKLYVHYADGSGEVLAQGALNTSLNRWYHLKLEVMGDTIYGYLDGQLLGFGVPSDPLNGGYFGFGGSDDVIEIDNVHADYSTTDVSEGGVYHEEQVKFAIPSFTNGGEIGIMYNVPTYHKFTIKMFDISGSKIWENQFVLSGRGMKRLKLEMPEGVYFLYIEGAEKVLKRKLLVFGK